MEQTNIESLEFSWNTKDGLKIFAKDWSIEQPKAVIALVHGFGEHCMRYDSMAQYYNLQGYAMVGYDRRGHGQSEGKRGHTPSYQAFLDEVKRLIGVCMERYPGKPVVLYGHSMGGNIALNYIIDQLDDVIKLCVVTGPWIQLSEKPSPILVFIVKILRRFFPAFSQDSGIDSSFISRVKMEVDKYDADPLVQGKISLSTAYGMMQAGKKLDEYQGDLQVPTLIMHAGDDQLTDPTSSEAFANRVTGDVTFKKWDGLYHEIHNESIREQVYDYTINWINNKLK